MEKGKLIVIEGACDGIGKSTQFDLLGKRFESYGEKIINHHFPSYGTVHGAPVETYLAGEYGKPSELSPYFVNSMYALDRKITWELKLKEAYLAIYIEEHYSKEKRNKGIKSLLFLSKKRGFALLSSEKATMTS